MAAEPQGSGLSFGPDVEGRTAPAWQREMRESFRDIAALLRYLDLDPKAAPYPIDGNPEFPLLAPKSFVDRIRKGDWTDPLLLQILPRGEEREPRAGFHGDPVAERQAEKVPGLLHKYPGRVLLMPTPHCAVHCRYCFRREFPYDGLPRRREDWDAAYRYIADRPEIEEVIFSGGDPLMLADERLGWHWEKTLSIPHVRWVRFHTRVPIVLPARIDSGFLAMAERFTAEAETLMILHSNHAAEITPEVTSALRRLRRAGFQILHQGVALRDVNSAPESLREHWKALAQAGMTPYYHHLLDPVAGAGHFEIPMESAMETHRAAGRGLPGHAVPRLVKEIPLREGKVQVLLAGETVE